MVVTLAEDTTLADGSDQIVYSTGLDATFQFIIDLANMSGGDTLVVTILENLSIFAGSYRTVYQQTFSGAQTGSNVTQISPPLPFGRISIHIQQTAGVMRSYPWRVDSIGSWTQAGSGVANPMSTAETTLLTTATAGIYVLLMDLSNMGAGEIVTLRAYSQILAAGSQKLAHQYISPTGVQVDPNKLMVSLPLACPYGGKWTMQPNNTNPHNYTWVVRQIAA